MNTCCYSDRKAHCSANGVNHLNTRAKVFVRVGMRPEVLVVCLRDKMIVALLLVLLSPGTHLSKGSNWTTRIFLPPLHPRGIITHKWTHFSTRNSRFLIGGEHWKILRRFDSVRCSCWHDKSPVRGQFEFATARRETAAARTFTRRALHRHRFQWESESWASQRRYHTPGFVMRILPLLIPLVPRALAARAQFHIPVIAYHNQKDVGENGDEMMVSFWHILSLFSLFWLVFNISPLDNVSY